MADTTVYTSRQSMWLEVRLTGLPLGAAMNLLNTRQHYMLQYNSTQVAH